MYNVMYVINFLGLLGSILSCIVFSRKAFRKSSIRIYCKFLAIFDQFTIFNLIFGLTTLFSSVQIINENDAICKFVYFISVGVSGIPGWILVIFSVDQYLKITMTKRFSFRKKSWFQYVVIAVIVLVHFALYIDVIFESGVRNATIGGHSQLWCDINVNSAMPVIYLVETSLIPFGIMVVTTLLILRSLYRVRKRVSSEIKSNSHSVISNKSRDFKFAFNSVILNFIFILLTSPLVIYYLINFDDYTISQFVNTICFVFFYLNFASHFWIYFFVNSIFRNELLILFRIRKE